MKRKFLLLFFTTLAHCLYGQERSVVVGTNFEYNGTTKLISIAFGGVGRIFITRDDNFLKHDTTYAWRIPNKTNPVAYVSGNRPLVEAKFSSCKDAVWAKGVASDGHEFPVQKLKIDVASTGIYEMKASSKIFEKHRVKFYDPFEIVWFLSIDSINFTQIGKSQNPLYVTYDKPIPKSLIDTLPYHKNVYHSVIHYGCKSANGLNDSIDIVKAMYQKTFIETNRKIKRIDNPQKNAMKYWGEEIALYVPKYEYDFETLIRVENATCGNWADFFHRMILSQGIESSYIATVEPSFNNQTSDTLPIALKTKMLGKFSSIFGQSAKLKPIKNNFTHNFFVNNWDFTNENSFYAMKDTLFIEKTNASIKILPADLKGVEGQGNDDPRAWFNNHALVLFNQKYYDPSYGSGISSGLSESVWENQALKAFGSSGYIEYIDFFTKEQKIEELIHWVNKFNDSSKQILVY